MKISEIIRVLEGAAAPSLQESYDNAGLLTGHPEQECKGILCCLDATEEVVAEALSKGCNLVVAHHPIIFGGLKKINGKNYVERTVIRAIKNDIAIYAIHTNLDNVMDGVNGRIADQLGLRNRTVLQPKTRVLKKLFTFVPVAQAPGVREALFAAGAGHIGRYSECSFNAEGLGTFRGGEDTHPFAGTPGLLQEEREIKMEMIFPAWLERQVLAALKASHPYEEVAYDLVTLDNLHGDTGSGLMGELPGPLSEKDFLTLLHTRFHTPVLRHTALRGRPVQKLAICGGAGSFLIPNALSAGVDAFVTADLKYHEFFEADGRLLLCDLGHYESEQFTTELLQEVLRQKFPTFAVLKTEVKTNPVQYHYQAGPDHFQP